MGSELVGEMPVKFNDDVEVKVAEAPPPLEQPKRKPRMSTMERASVIKEVPPPKASKPGERIARESFKARQVRRRPWKTVHICHF